MPLKIFWSLLYIGLQIPQANYTLADYTKDPRYAMCTNTESEAYCSCAIRISNFLEDNDKILDIFYMHET